LAEERGFSSLWVTESRFTRDAVSRASMLAATTIRCVIGTAVVNPFTRSVGVLAITAATIDEACGGRFILGLGAGSEKFITSQGCQYSLPLERLEESISIIRSAWKGENVTFHGKTLDVDDFSLGFGTVRTRIPIYLGVTGRKAIELATRVGDGIILNAYTSGDYAAEMVKLVGKGDKVKGLPVVGNLIVSMAKDSASALEAVRPLVYTYVTSFPAIARANGLSENEVRHLIELGERDHEAAEKALSEKWITQLTAAGDAEDCRRKVEQFIRLGLDEVLVTPVHGEPARVVEELSPLL